jgi:hypothetical protein
MRQDNFPAIWASDTVSGFEGIMRTAAIAAS